MARSSESANSLLALGAVIFLMAAGVEGALRFSGKCPNLDAVPNMNPALLKGDWYENRHYSPIFERVDRCQKYSFAQPFGPYIPLELSGRNSRNFQSTSVTGGATLLGPTGILSVKFPSESPIPTNYYVIGTDYASYAVLWSCQDANYWNIQNAVVLTRSRNPSPYTVEAALRIADAKYISRYMFMPADQTFC